jgi:phosphoglycolate phosphatase
MRKYQAIIFDFDGTLIDSAPGIVLSLAELLKTMGREPLTEERLRACVGPPIVQFFPEYLGFHGEELDRAMITYREIFNKTALGMLCAFPGVVELLRDIQLAGMRTGVATCKGQQSCETQAESLGLLPYLNNIKGVDTSINLLEKTDILRALLDEMNIDPRHAIMVGDRMYDLIAAKAVGMPSIGVLYGGCSTVEELAAHDPLYIVESVEQLRETLLSEQTLAQSAV